MSGKKHNFWFPVCLTAILLIPALIFSFPAGSAAAAVVNDNSVSADMSGETQLSSSGAETTESASGVNQDTNVSSSSFSNKNNVVTTKNLNMRSGASSSSSVVKSTKKGTVLYVTNNSSGSWVKVKDSLGISGYVPTRYINKGSGSSVIMNCKTNDDLNLRKGAGTDYAVLTVIPKGSTVTLTNNSNYNWAKVKYNGQSGYISSSYASFIFKIPVDKSQPIYFNSSTGSMYKGCYYQPKIINNTDNTIKWSSSNTGIATVSRGIVYGKKAGTVTVKAAISSKTVSCKITVKNPSRAVNISNKSYTANRGKTIYLTSGTKGVNWSSSDTSVATVSKGLVYCKKKGKAVIYAKISGGWATCVVTVKGREAVRFAYANPNSSPLNSNVTFIAITDKLRTGVKFAVTVGSSTYNIKATSKTASGNTYIWKGTKKLTKAGSYKIVAYSKYNNKWSKSTGSYGKAFVTKATSNTQVSCEERHASNNIINFISNYEGFLSSAIYDPLTGFPCLTVGYGRVIYAGETFYNGMTKKEAFAYLVDSVEKDGYVTKVNNFLLTNKIKFNQRQFDSLVSFVYNCGTGILNNDSSVRGVLLNTYPSSSSGGSSGKVTTKCALRKGAGTSYDSLKTLTVGTKVTLLSAKLYNNDWYKVKSGGKTGYVSYKFINITSFTSKGTRNLNYAIKQNYIKYFLQYHHAGGLCYPGLLYRRIDEAEIFYYGDYTRDGSSNKYKFIFTCSSNSGFGT